MYVFAYFSGISDCGRSSYPVPNGRTLLLQQSIGNDCEWQHLGDVYHCFWEPSWQWPNNSRLRLLDVDGFSFFSGVGAHCPAEIARYPNSQNTCILMYAGAGGFCMVDWSGILLTQAVELGIDFKPKLMRESRDIDAVHSIYKFTSLYQRTNLKLKFEL